MLGTYLLDLFGWLDVVAFLRSLWSWVTSDVITLPVWVALALVVAFVVAFVVAVLFFVLRAYRLGAMEGGEPYMGNAEVTPADLTPLQIEILQLYVTADDDSQTADKLAPATGKKKVEVEHALEDLEAKRLMYSGFSSVLGVPYSLSREGKAFVVEHDFT